ncbi:hypothetical protein LI951_04010 [Enterococcus sp. BWT-B8]|uniref:hypothetical protein n=1 Tax=Enterococcus sp. BWT-B8 TaxID=2885157 RepID=UPI001E2DB130|nr:hypothetical protein [Enterococcus sp. BWT-B8]MCB5951224.1 hypothetical protein [Enterococcus sp. BWT-B8]
MENLNKYAQGNKKIFLRKEIEQERLGEEIYAEDILCQYSVYLVRKFEEQDDYLELSQMENLLKDLPERFNKDFQDIVTKNMYVRTVPKAVYVTLLLALPQPLTKFQIVELKNWMGALTVPSLALEHTSNFMEPPVAATTEMVREWQETNSEVLLLTEMMNQYNESLTDIYSELQVLKSGKTPPVMKVIKSEAAAKKTLEKENENSQRIDETIAKLDKMTEEFQAFKQQVVERLESTSVNRKPPKFKIYFDGKEKRNGLDQRVEQALEQVQKLTAKTDFSQQEIEKLTMKLEKESRRNRELLKNQLLPPQGFEEQNNLEEKMAITSKEVSMISHQLKEINDKLSTVETKVSEAEQTPEELAQQVKEHGQIQETISETMKLNQVISQLTEKLQSVESELTDVKQKGQKKVPVMKLKKSETVKKLSEQHNKDQEQLKMNAMEIKKLSQTVGKVDVQLIQANQKIAELEQKVRVTGGMSGNRINSVHPSDGYHRENEPVQALTNQPQQQNDHGATRSFPTKESFLQASRPMPTAYQQRTNPVPAESQTPQGAPTVTLAIEEMLDRVSDHPKRTEPINQPVTEQSRMSTTSLRRLKKLEGEIYSSFKRVKGGIGSRGMVSKEDFYSNIRQIEVLPYLWSTIETGDEPQDMLLNNELSCQQLVNSVPTFLDEVEELASKRKVMGKWIYCPKEVEQKMEGFKLLNEYFELYLSNRTTG